MYQTILVTLESTAADRTIVDHVKQLAKIMKSRVVLLHVVTGPVAQYHRDDAAGEETDKSRSYVETVRNEFVEAGIPAQAELAFGEPGAEIIKWVEEKGCDLVAMSTHGHKFLADLILGATASRVQHNIRVPVLLLRAKS